MKRWILVCANCAVMASWLAMAGLLPVYGQQTSAHPLDPLSIAEIEAAVAIVKAQRDVSDGIRFPTLTLAEPDKKQLAAYAEGIPVPRRAAAVVIDPGSKKTSEAILDLDSRRIISWKDIPGVQPLVMLDEYDRVTEIVRADPQWQAAMRSRGITDLEKVYLDGWAPGIVDVAGSEDARLMRVPSFYQGDGTNAYGRPIEGVVAVVNLDTGKVVELVDTGAVPIPEGTGTDFFDPREIGPTRQPPRPLVIRQPNGPSFEIHGHEIRWQKWRFRYTLHPREGLVLHTVGFEQDGRVRPILHRASVAEMVVPYGDPDQNWNWRSAFDQGEYGLGRTCSSLESGKDVPENAVLLDAVFADDRGAPYVQSAAIAVYEQDGGMLWKHYDFDSETSATRRARDLVICYVATIGNYDYFLNWIFRQDGTLELRVDLSGILLVKGVESQTCLKCQAAANKSGGEPQGDQRFGTLVGKNTVATNHQHIFSFRLDFDVDGAGNSVYESNVRGIPAGTDNPLGNAFIHVETPLRTEAEARRNLSFADHRSWKVLNPSVQNELGHFAAYLLHPGDNSVPYVRPDSVVAKRAGFINHHLWVTRYRPEETHAAGEYPRQRIGGEGLPQWSGDESLEDQDLVVWYTLAVTHIPRVEEWPVMTSAHTGFKLVPAGFFTRNPAIDVP